MASPQKPTAPATSAGQQVIATYELLETILDYLAPTDVLLVHRVSHQFNALINNSSVLQKKFQLSLSDRVENHPLFPTSIGWCYSCPRRVKSGQPARWMLVYEPRPVELEPDIKADPQSWQEFLFCRAATTPVDNTRGAKDGRDRRERLGLRSDKGITFGQLVKWVWEGRDGQGIFAGQWWIYVDCEGRPVDA
ncbi:uncharacterized protein CLAFUR5_10524 [Fulvia fulva]|uniref:F-box domain-containing protein n=1 Tax=Passalora fulva TaxID=5499 RepID=A0A9Q8PC86_PASFU|nr:uncharacterized protein CLAFUR5_10524 [Fulvia fulva]UJO19756.1 hypothetical protein CLAFUR5_10524 [Fulvia fulva]